MPKGKIDSSEDINQHSDNKCFSLIIKIIIISLIVIIVALLACIIALAVKKNKVKEVIKYNSKEENEQDKITEQIFIKSENREPWYDIYGNKTDNIKYAINKKIENSFKINGDNYDESIGNINNGHDYDENERNIYSLYIPYEAKLRNKQNKHIGIILFIHGGGWVERTKNDTEHYASRYAKSGYITANVEYTVLSDNYTHYNIFRILDEITACIKHLKQELLNQGFKENNLEFAMGGVSAGAHITLLYAHKMKNHIFDIKFLIDVVGPISLLPEYWYIPTEFSKVLDSIEERSEINDGINEGKIKKLFDDEYKLVNYMNLFIGKKYTQQELQGMVENKLIKTDNEKYQEMLNIVKNAFPINYIDGRYPLLCEYCGNDQEIGVAHYSYIKEKYRQNDKLDFLELVYMKYGGHELYHYEQEQSIEAMQEMHYKILDYAKNYFTSD